MSRHDMCLFHQFNVHFSVHTTLVHRYLDILQPFSEPFLNLIDKYLLRPFFFVWIRKSFPSDIWDKSYVILTIYSKIQIKFVFWNNFESIVIFLSLDKIRVIMNTYCC